jgi:branched-chain amino acid transport system permease protein
MIQQLILNGIIAGSIYALIALGFTIIYRTVRFFHFAHGVVYTSGAYLAYTIVRLALDNGLRTIDWIVACLVGIVGAGFLGILIDRFVYYPLEHRKHLI